MNLDILEVLQGSLNNKGGVEKFNSLSLPLGEGNLDAEPSAIGKLRVVRFLEGEPSGRRKADLFFSFLVTFCLRHLLKKKNFLKSPRTNSLPLFLP